jgi:hypothetical protein
MVCSLTDFSALLMVDGFTEKDGQSVKGVLGKNKN